MICALHNRIPEEDIKNGPGFKFMGSRRTKLWITEIAKYMKFGAIGWRTKNYFIRRI